MCWRFARQLAHEFGVEVTLWVDDTVQAARFLKLAQSEFAALLVDGVHLRAWPSPWTVRADETAAIANGHVLIEAFACTLPDALLMALGKARSPLVWINLEYLSAESWVEEHHLLASLISLPVSKANVPPAAKCLQKTFFFPGFSTRTGGLLRESGLLARHAAWQAQEVQERRRLLEAIAPDLVADCAEGVLLVSVFTYESAALQSCLAAMAEDDAPVLCLVPEGRALCSVQAFLGESGVLRAGQSATRGALRIGVIPFLSQDDYDRLLSVCDFNFVRGEDSFVRAQWAARPFLWHIYPQEEQAHLVKLEAFLRLYCVDEGVLKDVQAGAGMALREFVTFWNQDEDCRELWHHLRPQLLSLRQRAKNWQQHLAEMPDLAANLMRFCRNRLR